MPTAFGMLWKIHSVLISCGACHCTYGKVCGSKQIFALLIRQRIRYSAGVMPSSDLKSLKRVIRVISAASAISSAEMGRG